ncbi:MAG: hypothetical protein VCA36_04005, partial [Opitutales bacterium]
PRLRQPEHLFKERPRGAVLFAGQVIFTTEEDGTRLRWVISVHPPNSTHRKATHGLLELGGQNAQ